MTTEAVIIGNPNSGSAGGEGYLERFAETLRAGDNEGMPAESEERSVEHPQEPAEEALGARRAEDGRQP